MPFDNDIYHPAPALSNTALDAVTGYSEADAMLREKSEMQLADAILYEHPDYVANSGKWQKYYNVFESEDLQGYLTQHPRETSDVYAMRVQRAYFYNYCASVINLFVAYLFQAPIDRNLKMTGGTANAEELEEFNKDANRCGNSYAAVMQLVATYSQVFGHTLVLVDAPEADDTIESEQDRKDAGIRPYLTIFDATQVKDWAVDRFGKFDWVKVEVAPEEDRDFLHNVAIDVRTFMIYDREGWQKYNVLQGKHAKLIDSGDWPDSIRGRVPVVIFRNERKLRHEWFGTSALKDIADINLALMNWASYGDEEIVNRCLNILAMQRDTTGDLTPTISTYNILEYPPDAAAPTYLTPGETPLKLIMEWMARAKDEIYRLAAMGGSTGLLGVREATSGIAYAYEFNETNQSLSKKAESMENGENELFSLIAAWYGAEFNGTVTYPRDFGVDNFFQELDILQSCRDTLTSETAIKEQEKKTVGKMFSRKDTTFREKMYAEIDKAEAKAPSFVEGFGTVPGPLTSKQDATGSATQEETEETKKSSDSGSAKKSGE